MRGKGKRQPTLEEAKANFAASLGAVDPLRAIAERPLVTLGTTTALGVLFGYVGLKLMRKPFFRSSLALAVVKKLFL